MLDILTKTKPKHQSDNADDEEVALLQNAETEAMQGGLMGADIAENPAQCDAWAAVEEFVTVIYGKESLERIWFTSFEDIASGARWFGFMGFSELKRRTPDPTKADMYFTTGLMRPGLTAGRSTT